jgi:hypothetical protein
MVIPISASKITRTKDMPTDVSGHKIRNIAATGNCNRDKNTESQKMSTGNFYDWRHQTTQKTNLASLIKIDRLTFLQEIEIRKTMYLQFKLQIVGGASLTALLVCAVCPTVAKPLSTVPKTFLPSVPAQPAAIIEINRHDFTV